MKKIFLTLAILSTLFIGCTSDDNIEDRPIFELAEAPVLTAPEAGTSYVFTFETKDLLAERFTFTDADFNFDSATNYIIQVDTEGNEFASAQELGSGSSLQIPVSVDSFNNAALALGLAPGEPSNVEVRIAANVGAGEPQYSESRIVVVTPFTTEAPKFFIIGNFLSAGGYGDDWTPAATLPTIEAAEFGATAFQGYIFLNNASPEFKVLPTNTSFEGDYGDADGSGSSGILVQEGESNMRVSEAGYYKIDADFTDPENITWTSRKQVWGIIGAATPTGWDSDTDLTYDAASQTWSIVIDLTVDEFKFRANDNWDDPQDNLGTGAEDGQLGFNGGNLSVDTAGTYMVTLDLSNPNNYTYTLTPQ
ncbi:SusE domain-containing protein [Aquimarina sp. MMG015]|uniref:SusE domain-containing protein n=1 Tax=Aquimarina sp. MMG015 TaxID=2822689 RepID=UPI001B3A765F|nr:SusE domain-containing protein [Aquimarina sp. MMG015]MBQ4803981.1 SusE domain-containing protein [Aquimarina sp. MMG015]